MHLAFDGKGHGTFYCFINLIRFALHWIRTGLLSWRRRRRRAAVHAGANGPPWKPFLMGAIAEWFVLGVAATAQCVEFFAGVQREFVAQVIDDLDGRRNHGLGHSRGL